MQFCSNMMLSSRTKLVYHSARIRSLVPSWLRLSSIDAILDKLHQSLDPRNIPIIYHKISIKITPTHTNKHPQPLTQPNAINIPPAPDTDADAAQPSSEISLAHTTIFYIGSESVGLTNLLMTNASSKVRLLFLLTHHYIQNFRSSHLTQHPKPSVSNPHEQTNSSCVDMLWFKKRGMQMYSGY